MEDLSLNVPIIKAVKKVTHSGIVKKARLTLNPENDPVQGFIRSQSFKNITKFVPRIMPRKSTFIPTPLKLNNHDNIIHKKKDEDEKQLSEDEVKIIESESAGSLASSDINNSSNEEIEEQINKNKDKEDNKKKEDDKDINKDKDNNNTLNNNIEKIEPLNIENDADSLNLNDMEEHKSLRAVRRKMSLIRVKAGKIKSKETKDIISDNLKNAFDFDLKKTEKKEGETIRPKMHASMNFFGENKSNVKQKTISIFEVLSSSKKKKDDDNDN